jgi:hypothetical protein
VSANRDTASVVGIGVVACAACCAGPIVGALGAIGIGIGTLAGAMVFGAGALVVAVIVATVLLGRRRANRSTEHHLAHHTCAPGSSCCTTPSEVQVAIRASRTSA